MAHHDRHAAVLERAGGHHELELEPDAHVVPRSSDERRPAFTERNRPVERNQQRLVITPNRVAGTIDVSGRETRRGSEIEVMAAVGAPARYIKGKGRAGRWV